MVDQDTAPTLSDEHIELHLFSPDDIEGLPMPDGYRASIRAMQALEPQP
ncbi:hypothetical protein [Cryptosporangium sp. NPDC051539]